MTESHPCCQSYVLRVWKEKPDGELQAYLRNIASGECYNYASLKDLNILLSQQAERDSIQVTPIRFLAKIFNS